jgi:mannan endo-1,4-beta-mannosidase
MVRREEACAPSLCIFSLSILPHCPPSFVISLFQVATLLVVVLLNLATRVNGQNPDTTATASPTIPDTDSLQEQLLKYDRHSHYSPSSSSSSTITGISTPLVSSQEDLPTTDNSTTATSTNMDRFLTICGTTFCIGGTDSTYYLAGTNRWDLHALQEDEGIEGSKASIYNAIKTHADKGANVIRIFSHSEAKAGYGKRPIQPKLGEYGEDALAVLDYTLSVAREFGIRLILVMTNFEPFTGGIQQYVDWTVGQGKDKELFYTDPGAKQAYKDYVSMLLNRVNTVTGIKYKDDSVIGFVELMNEPHTRDNWESNNGIEPGSLVFDWLKEMSTWLKETVGLKSLLLSGEEGYRSDGYLSDTDPHYYWINRVKGVDFKRNVQDIPLIDAATCRGYPDNWLVAPWKYKTWYSDVFFKDLAGIAHGAGKPIIMEEYGLSLGRPNWEDETREEVLGALNEAANENGFAGGLVWEVDGEEETEVFAGYSFSYGGKLLLLLLLDVCSS